MLPYGDPGPGFPTLSSSTQYAGEMARTLYLVCYDIANPTRLRRVRKEVRAYAVGGQKSFYECWMTDSEYGELLDTLRDLIDPKTDRVHFFELDPRQQPLFFGQASRQSIQPFMIL